jgi:hypothetical protein|tara:strand:+ start:702 stop:1115 length:414 start_codon:yes stop_codon:yes gene_type:complete
MQVIGAMAQIAASQQAAKAHRASGEAEAVALRDKAEQAENKAQDEEILRLQNIRRTISTQRAYWAAAGIDPSTGSPDTIASRSYETFELDQGAALINTRSQIRSYNKSADAAIKISNIKARGSLLSGAMGAAQTWNT